MSLTLLCTISFSLSEFFDPNRVRVAKMVPISMELVDPEIGFLSAGLPEESMYLHSRYSEKFVQT